MSAMRAVPRADGGVLHPLEVFPPTRLTGRCCGCLQLVFSHQPHEWAERTTRELCRPSDPGARLYCGSCSSAYERSR